MIFSLLEVGVILFLIVLSVRAIMSGMTSEERAKLNVTHLNEQFKKRQSWLRHMMMSPETRDVAERLEAREEKTAKKQKTKRAKRELKSQRKDKSKRSTPDQESQASVTGDAKKTAGDSLNASRGDAIDDASLNVRAADHTQGQAIQETSEAPGRPSTPDAPTVDQPDLGLHPESSEPISHQAQEVSTQETHTDGTTGEGPNEDERPRLFVLNFKGDIQASAVESLREEITAVLQIKRDGDEVLLCLHNAGGYVHTHGLAASQLTRLTSAGVSLTVAIDQVAASGGYMMACVGERIIAAPFAIVGSIGVVAQLPNVNRLLKRYDVDVELHTAGDYKRTLTVLGENTDEGRAKFVEELHKTHSLFQNFVRAQRPKLDVAAVATGETWYGTSAIDVGLVDEIMTSDELVLRSLKTHEVYLMEYRRKTKASERVLSWAHALFNGRLPEI